MKEKYYSLGQLIEASRMVDVDHVHGGCPPVRMLEIAALDRIRPAFIRGTYTVTIKKDPIEAIQLEADGFVVDADKVVFYNGDLEKGGGPLENVALFHLSEIVGVFPYAGRI